MSVVKSELLNWLLNMGYDVHCDFLDVLENIEDGYADLEEYKTNPKIYDEEEISFLKTDIEDWEQEILNIKWAFLKENKNADWEQEVEKVKKYGKD